MQILLLRHARAVRRGALGYPGDDRPLTEQGVREITRASKGIARIVPDVDMIITSPLSRAVSTARIVRAAFGKEVPLKIWKSLLPDGETKRLFEELASLGTVERLMLVGHNPGMEAIAASLLGFTTPVVKFKKGSLCRIDVTGLPPTEPGHLIWHVTPKMLNLRRGPH
jgi:phosphohistidine phosphatase